MSSNHYLYYGVYLICEGKRSIEVDGNSKCSADPCHGIPYHAKFCPVCGGNVIMTRTNELVGFLDLRDEESNDFIKKNYGPLKDIRRIGKSFDAMYIDGVSEDEDILVPENPKIFGRHFNDDDEGYDSLEVPTKKIMILNEVKIELQYDIALLRKYLYKKVSIKFGSISSWA